MSKAETYRKFAIGFLFIALIFQTFAQALIVGDYYFRTATYAALCINKDKPGMHCQGHCQMAKQMEKEQNNDQDAPQISLTTSVVYFISDTTGIDIITPVTVAEKKSFPLIQESATFNQPKNIFQPPQNC